MYTVVPGAVGSPVAVPASQPQQFVTRLSSLIGQPGWGQAPVAHIDLKGRELIRLIRDAVEPHVRRRHRRRPSRWPHKHGLQAA